MVAFANRGAKDVTQRYVGSALAADKLRDNSWWEQTLRPLRKHEASPLWHWLKGSRVAVRQADAMT